MQVIAAAAVNHPGRVGFVIGKRALPTAVARNRVRRVLRTVMAGARPAAEAFDVILRLKRGCTREEVAAVAVEARSLLDELIARPGRDAAL